MHSHLNMSTAFVVQTHLEFNSSTKSCKRQSPFQLSCPPSSKNYYGERRLFLETVKQNFTYTQARTTKWITLDWLPSQQQR
ncbi:hypothetical protein NQ317_008763 [Molorchus minor]|uniref:Uncharacterized protein n=1 Tax=Molorchus minor TaxID=1323400 RepID=A0ABQ9J3X8_9CUCU|nr:hypothetical protein NQ317_008763 [Molorchus minor]